MEVRIGIVNNTREISFESAKTAPELETEIAAALDSGAAHLSLTDDKGRRFLIPTGGIAYVELGSESERRVGFVA